MNSTLSTEVTNETLQQAHAVLNHIGLDIKSYINMSLKALIHSQGLPFSTKSTQKTPLTTVPKPRKVVIQEKEILDHFQETLRAWGKTDNTAYQYRNAVANIAKHENLGLSELMATVSTLASAYAKDGEKASLGNEGKGTWRNALRRFEEYVIAQNSPVAMSMSPKSKRSHLLGSMADDIWIADDFDAPLTEFEEYM